MLVGSQSCARHISAGNVEQNVNTSPLGNDVIGKFLKAGDVQHVTDDTDNIFTIGFQFLYTLVQLFLTDVYRYDFSALLHKTLGNAATQYTTCWEKVTNLNMNGTVYPSLVFSKVMAKQGKGCIVNVSSMAAYSAITRVPGYSAAKTAVANFTQWLASELALKYGDGIRVNAIAPGFFIGDQNRAVLINPDGSLTDRSKKVLAKTPMKRFGDINELNGAVQFLCSDAASFVTGALLPIDGGFCAFSGV